MIKVLDNPRLNTWLFQSITMLERYGVAVRAINAMQERNIQTVGDLLTWKIIELFSIENFGVTYVGQTMFALKMCGFSIPDWKVPKKSDIKFRDDNPPETQDLTQDELARLVP